MHMWKRYILKVPVTRMRTFTILILLESEFFKAISLNLLPLVPFTQGNKMSSLKNNVCKHTNVF